MIRKILAILALLAALFYGFDIVLSLIYGVLKIGILVKVGLIIAFGYYFYSTFFKAKSNQSTSA